METKKIIIIVILIAILVAICSLISYSLFFNHTEYTNMTISESATTIEIPDDMKIKSTNDDSGITVLENDNTIVVIFNSMDKSIAQIMAFSNIKNPIFGSESQGETTITDPTVAGCHLDGDCPAVFIGNDETHDNILVISKNKDIVTHIINSIKWSINKNNNSTDDSSSSASSSSSSNSQSAYAYKSDGTPMYSQSEVDSYMQNKYGEVNYHIGSNGYVDMDEPGYDDAGNYKGNSKARN